MTDRDPFHHNGINGGALFRVPHAKEVRVTRDRRADERLPVIDSPEWDRWFRLDRYVELVGSPVSDTSCLLKMSWLLTSGLIAEMDVGSRSDLIAHLRRGVWPEVHMNGDLKKVLRLAHELGIDLRVKTAAVNYGDNF